MLKPNGSVKLVFPAIERQESLLLQFLVDELNLQLQSRLLPRQFSYVPASATRPHIETFAIFFSFSQRELSEHWSVLQPSSFTSGTCIETMARLNKLVMGAMEDFVSSQQLTKKLMQTVWLKGCYLGALLISEAQQTSNHSDVAIFRFLLLL